MADKKNERRGLGRGLSALMADVAQPESPNTPPVNAPAAEMMLRVDRIAPNADQPRKDFRSEDLEDLANSIREKGIIQPLIVRAHPSEDGMYEIVAGERRWRAAQAAKLHEAPVIVRDYDDTEMLEIAIIENIQRAELNSIEEAAGYRQLMDRFGHTQEKIAEALGKSRSHIANLLRLLNLPDTVQAHVREGALSAGHARALVTAKAPEAMANDIIRKNLSVRDAERMVKNEGVTKPRETKTKFEKDADTRLLETDLSAATGMKVSIDNKPNAQNGKLVIDYKDFDELDRLCNALSKIG